MLLDVFLRNSRDYVQGTQMIARAAEQLEGSGWRLAQAQFSNITDQRVALSAEPFAPADSLGQIRFQRDEVTQLFYVGRTDQPAPQRQADLPVRVERTGEKDVATYRFSGAGGFEDLLNALVQALTAEHERDFPGSYDIWFSGLRNFQLPVQVSNADGSGEVRLERQRILVSPGAYQSLWTASLTYADGTISSGVVTFAFKSKEAINVR